MVNSLYFIYKNDKSTLAEEILALKTGVGQVETKTNITAM